MTTEQILTLGFVLLGLLSILFIHVIIVNRRTGNYQSKQTTSQQGGQTAQQIQEAIAKGLAQALAEMPKPVPATAIPIVTSTKIEVKKRGWFGKLVLASILVGIAIFYWTRLDEVGKLWWIYQASDYFPWNNQETVVLTDNIVWDIKKKDFLPNVGWSEKITPPHWVHICNVVVNRTGGVHWLRVNGKGVYEIDPTVGKNIPETVQYLNVGKQGVDTLVVRIRYIPLGTNCNH